VTDNYITGFKRAHLAFLHQIVYDPIQRKQIPLNPLPDDVDHDLLKFAGQYVSNNSKINFCRKYRLF
jgi:exonuclease-1